MSKDVDYKLTPEGAAKIEAVDDYLGDAIRDGRPIEALVATKRLGEVVSDRAKQAARAATDGSWSWSDVGSALGMSKQAAHEKLRVRVEDELAKARSKLKDAEADGRAKIARRAKRKRDGLGPLDPTSAKGRAALQRIDDWEQGQNDKLDRDIRKARDQIERAERTAHLKIDR